MTIAERINQIEKLKKKHSELLLKCKPMQAATVLRQIKALEIEHVPLRSILPEMTREEKDEAMIKMNKIFVYSDLLDSAAIEFDAYLKKFGIVSTVLSKEVKAIKKSAINLINFIDGLNSEELSDLHADICDECKFPVENIINKHMKRYESRYNPK
ncbi:hypothetical protein [uncultured Bacteroides sp.]|uniref:hypothetical protein n=1 Tax=uncultured Bacteroides sp. TaxID=162156 RepID=UPI002621A3B9|nr:hypothetical protein [uncultured Bacteroides sp.]